MITGTTPSFQHRLHTTLWSHRLHRSHRKPSLAIWSLGYLSATDALSPVPLSLLVAAKLPTTDILPMIEDLHSWLAEVPGTLAFTMGAYPWGEEGTVLANSDGPEDWAVDLMN